MSSNRLPGISTAPLAIAMATHSFARRRGAVPGPVGANPVAPVGDAPVQAAPEWPWWEIIDPGPDYPNTAIPLFFTLRVHAWIFHIKPNATKHLAERAAASANSATEPVRDKVASGTPRDERTVRATLPYPVVPISQLAAAIETVMKRGLLDGIIASRSGRVGSEELPLRIGDLELAFEFVGGRVELFHCNYVQESKEARKAGS